MNENRMSHFVGVGLVLGFLLPHTYIWLLLVNPFLCLFYQLLHQNRIYYKNNWIVVIPILLSFILNASQGVAIKHILSAVTVLMYFLCFPIVRSVRIPNGYLFFIIVFIFVSQVSYALNIPGVVSFIDRAYPISEYDTEGIEHMRNTITLGNLLSYRLGGIYRNANICAKFICFLLAFFLVLNNNRLRLTIPYVLICFVSIILTGSRTGFVIASLIIIVALIRSSTISAVWKSFITIAFIVGLLFLLKPGSSYIRGLDVIGGLENSANVKFNAFADYLQHEDSIIRMLIGYLAPDRFIASEGVMASFDADYGYLVFQYGFIGFLAILIYYCTIFKRFSKRGRLFLIVMLWMITSTIVTSYRAFFVYMLMLSTLYGGPRGQQNREVQLKVNQ